MRDARGGVRDALAQRRDLFLAESHFGSEHQRESPERDAVGRHDGVREHAGPARRNGRG
jgi:hypothetical protein